MPLIGICAPDHAAHSPDMTSLCHCFETADLHGLGTQCPLVRRDFDFHFFISKELPSIAEHACLPMTTQPALIKPATTLGGGLWAMWSCESG